MPEWSRKNQIRVELTSTESEEGPENVEELSSVLDNWLDTYDRWVLGKGDSSLIPFERAAIKTFLMWKYMNG